MHGPALAQYVHQQQALRGIGGGIPGGPGIPMAGGPGKKHGKRGGPPAMAVKPVGGPAAKPGAGGMKVKAHRVF